MTSLSRTRAMQLFTLGLNHHTAPLAIRERVAFNTERLRSALSELTAHEPVKEAAILSTCNRTELYCALGAPQAALEWLAGYHRVQPRELKPYVYTLPQAEAVRHAFRVASGLDSMVVGEPQILGQMKEAARVAESAGTLGTLLNKLFQRSFAVAKEVRSNTGIGANVVSMAAAAVKLAARIFPSLAEQKVLLIGAGEMIELAATHFAAQQPRGIAVASRTLERAASTPSRSSCATCPSGCPSTTSSSPAPRARSRSSARARWSARCARAATAPCSWLTSPCPGTSKPKWRGWRTYSCIPSTTSRPRCARASTRANRRSRKPRRSSNPRSARSCTG